MIAIKPQNTKVFKTKIQIPQYVLDVVNTMAADSVVNGVATVYQDAVINRLESLGYNRNEIYGNYFLDFEYVYEEAGWECTYYKSPYYSTESSYWVFEEK